MFKFFFTTMMIATGASAQQCGGACCGGSAAKFATTKNVKTAQLNSDSMDDDEPAQEKEPSLSDFGDDCNGSIQCMLNKTMESIFNSTVGGGNNSEEMCMPTPPAAHMNDTAMCMDQCCAPPKKCMDQCCAPPPPASCCGTCSVEGGCGGKKNMNEDLDSSDSDL